MLEQIDWITVSEIALFVIGFILVGIEMYMPGLEGPGIAGAISLVLGIFMISDSIKQGVIITIVVIVILIIMFYVIVKFLSKGGSRSKVVLKEELKTETGYRSSNTYDELVGKKGRAVTDLRPSGTGKFDDKDYDIITEGKYIVKDTNIVVYKVEGVRIIVKEESDS